MAKAHSDEHSATGSPPETPVPTHGSARWAVVILGTNAWLAWAVWPGLVSTHPGAGALAWSALPLLVLVAGAASVRPHGPGRTEAALLVLGVPLALAAALCLGPAVTLDRLGGAPWLTLAAAALFAYGAAALSATRPRQVPFDVSVQPLSDDPWDAANPRRTALSRLVTTLLSGGALGLLVVAATWGGDQALDRAWGDAAAEGGVLTAVVAAAVAVTIVAVFLAAVLRAPPVSQGPPIDRPLRVASLMLLALLGATTYVVLH